MWTGTLSWGLVAIPVKLGKAASGEAVSFRQVHAADGGRIRYQRRCEKCAETVEYADIAKGAELPGREGTVMLSEDDLTGLPLTTARTIEVLYFASAAEIDPVACQASYYAMPAVDAAGRAYQLLLEALQDAGKVAICRLALRQRESLAMLTVRSGVLTLVTLYWPSEVRKPDFEVPGGDLGEAERAMARQLVEAGTRAFAPDEHHDRYAEALAGLVAAKTAGASPETAASPAAVADLTAALQASLAAMKPAAAPRPRRTTRKRAA